MAIHNCDICGKPFNRTKHGLYCEECQPIAKERKAQRHRESCARSALKRNPNKKTRVPKPPAPPKQMKVAKRKPKPAAKVEKIIRKQPALSPVAAFNAEARRHGMSYGEYRNSLNMGGKA